MTEKSVKLKVKDNRLWNLLDDGSKLAVIDLLISEGFEGEVKLIGVVKGNTTVIKVENNQDKELVLELDILSVLNQ